MADKVTKIQGRTFREGLQKGNVKINAPLKVQSPPPPAPKPAQQAPKTPPPKKIMVHVKTPDGT